MLGLDSSRHLTQDLALAGLEDYYPLGAFANTDNCCSGKIVPWC